MLVDAEQRDWFVLKHEGLNNTFSMWESYMVEEPCRSLLRLLQTWQTCAAHPHLGHHGFR